MLNFLSLLISPVTGALSTIFSAFFNSKTAVAQAQAGVETTAIQSTASIETRWWFVAAIISLWAMVFLIYDAKLVLWDKVLGLGVTDPLSSELTTVHLTIVGGLFLHSLVRRIT